MYRPSLQLSLSLPRESQTFHYCSPPYHQLISLTSWTLVSIFYLSLNFRFATTPTPANCHLCCWIALNTSTCPSHSASTQYFLSCNRFTSIASSVLITVKDWSWSDITFLKEDWTVFSWNSMRSIRSKRCFSLTYSSSPNSTHLSSLSSKPRIRSENKISSSRTLHNLFNLLPLLLRILTRTQSMRLPYPS